MSRISPTSGIGTLVNHAAEDDNPQRAHIPPIYQTSLFSFPDVATAAAVIEGDQPGYVYTRRDNPNLRQLGAKVAILEGLDLLRADPAVPPQEIVAGVPFATGMAAITSALLARVQAGDTIIAQRALYSGTFAFLENRAPQMKINVIWVQDNTPDSWEAALEEHPQAKWVYLETPANPTMEVVDLAMVAELAKARGIWVIVDNTFATPYGQRPLTLGADVVLHSTTKYLSGHGVIVGGAVVSTKLDYVHQHLLPMRSTLGGSPSPFDAWLANLGLKTFEIRMQRHCLNAVAVAEFLQSHPKVASVYYPGLPSHPGHELAKRQMFAYGGMLSFELKGGFQAAERMLNNVRLATLGVSLGNVDTLIEHPAGMTHAKVPREAREAMGLSDGLVRLSVGIENREDILADLGEALEKV